MEAFPSAYPTSPIDERRRRLSPSSCSDYRPPASAYVPAFTLARRLDDFRWSALPIGNVTELHGMAASHITRTMTCPAASGGGPRTGGAACCPLRSLVTAC
jgi:hypothetical protein